MSTSYLALQGINMQFQKNGEVFSALANIHLDIAQGEFVSLIGHSGCGKSTVLNIVAGLYQATSGVVLLDNKEVNRPDSDRAVVFQNHSLLPWLSCFENIELAVDAVFKNSMSKGERKAWVEHNLEQVSMSHAKHKLPHEVSGGMKQRIGIARALAMKPKVLLLDEPFGALDALTRSTLQDTLMRIQSELGNTMIMITHDVDEAVLLSDRIVMMTNGPAATIGDIVRVDLPRPRNRLELTTDAQYNHYRSQVLSFLHQKHKHADAA